MEAREHVGGTFGSLIGVCGSVPLSITSIFVALSRSAIDLFIGGNPNLNWSLEDVDLEMECCGALEVRGRRVPSFGLSVAARGCSDFDRKTRVFPVLM